jgi:saccharopine dehydrogenase (NAD+, L-lysine-forming)
MKTPKIIILGGYGMTGRRLCELLLRETGAHLTLAGRTRSKAQSFATKWNSHFPGERVQAVFADASDSASLDAAFQGMDILVVASSTAAYAQQVAYAALTAGIDYLDVQYSTAKNRQLQALAGKIAAAGRCFITDGGFHPGLPAALIRYAAPHFDALHSAKVGSVIQIDWGELDLGQATMEEFVGEFMDFQPLVYRDGRWQDLGTAAMLKPVWMVFPPPFGRRYGMPMYMEELHSLSDLIPGLQETAFYVGGLNWFVDLFLSPVIWASLKFWPHRLPQIARLMHWGLVRFSHPPYGTLLKLEARGVKDGVTRQMNLIVGHEDGYALTAIPVAACLLQMLDGQIHEAGLGYQALAVEPVRFLADMEGLGAQVSLEWQP